MPIPMDMYSLNGEPDGSELGRNNLISTNNNDTESNVITGIPKTPEILNLLAAISPLEECLKGRNHITADKLSASIDSYSADTCSSNSTVDSSTSPQRPSNIKLQFIKTNLKLTLERKRKNHTPINEVDTNPSSHDSYGKYDESSMDTEEDDGNSSQSEPNSSRFGLTPEDEERRKRRRERNKIAATKCRMKKRVRQDLLFKESSILENQNQELKLKIKDLREEYKRLQNMYSGHKGNCVKPSPEPSPVEDLSQPPSFSVTNNTNVITNPVYPNNYENIPLPAEMHHNDYNANSFVRNPSVMFSESDETCKNNYFGQNGPSEDSSYKLMPPMPSFNLVDDSGNHFDMTYVQ